MTPRKPKPRKLPTPGHYRPPTMKLPGMSTFNAPGRGRVGKQLPSPKKLGKKR